MALKQNPRLERAELRGTQYVGLWKHDLLSSPLYSPGICALAVCCPWCVSYYQRKRALRHDLTRYLCCNGDWPCSGRMSEQRCPAFCLAMEVMLCFPQSVASTRWMLQDEMHLRNTQCDNCIIGTTLAMQYLACLCWCAAIITGSDGISEFARILDWTADLLWCSVCACIMSQHKIQMDERDAHPEMIQTPHPMMQPPQVQMMVAPPAGEVVGIPAAMIPPPQHMPVGYPPASPVSYTMKE